MKKTIKEHSLISSTKDALLIYFVSIIAIITLFISQYLAYNTDKPFFQTDKSLKYKNCQRNQDNQCIYFIK